MIVSTVPETEGYVAFKHPSLPEDIECRTWYRVVGNLSSGRRPLVTLHGGPGAGPIYLTTPFDKYAATTGTPVIYYDQIGNGKSTHLRQKRLDESFWTIELFLAELDNLLRHLKVRDDFDLYGQSWGAMMAGKFAVSRFAEGCGLRRMVLGSGPCDIKAWVKTGERLVAELPEKEQEIIRKYSEREEWDNPEYKDAVMQIYKVHMCRLDPWPQILLDAFEQLESDDTVYMTMEGPDEIHVTGNLRGNPCVFYNHTISQLSTLGVEC